MVTRKSGEDSPSAKVFEQRPGSYVQVASSRRKRMQEGGEGAGPSGEPRAGILREGFLDELPTSKVTLAEEQATPSIPVDDLRPGRALTPAKARRAIGPLGMEDARPPETPAAVPTAEPRQPAAGAAQKWRIQVVEINPPDLTSEGTTAPISSVPPAAPSNDVRPPSGAPPRTSERPDPFAPRGVSEGARLHAFPGAAPRVVTLPPPGLQNPAADPFADSGLDDFSDNEATTVASGALAHDEAPTIEHKSLSAFDAEAVLYEQRRAEMARPSLSSVLDARPSLRPSPPPPRETLSLAWRVVVGGLCLVIVAAIFVALRGGPTAETAAEKAGSTALERPDAPPEQATPTPAAPQPVIPPHAAEPPSRPAPAAVQSGASKAPAARPAASPPAARSSAGVAAPRSAPVRAEPVAPAVAPSAPSPPPAAFAPPSKGHEDELPPNPYE